MLLSSPSAQGSPGGLDDVRPIIFFKQRPMDIYANEMTQEHRPDFPMSLRDEISGGYGYPAQQDESELFTIAYSYSTSCMAF